MLTPRPRTLQHTSEMIIRDLLDIGNVKKTLFLLSSLTFILLFSEGVRKRVFVTLILLEFVKYKIDRY